MCVKNYRHEYHRTKNRNRTGPEIQIHYKKIKLVSKVKKKTNHLKCFSHLIFSNLPQGREAITDKKPGLKVTRY